MANALTLTDEQTEFTPQQRQALQALGIGAIGPGDLQIFLHECQKTGLDPFQKQIYLIRRGDKSTIQVGIDGLRTIARRAVMKTGEAFGEAPILWCGGDGVWRNVWLSQQAPAAAKTSVKRGEGTFTAVALFREFAPMYNGKLSGLWAKMPAHMIGKVAEAHALRKAFPAEMSGMYTDDEMEQAGPATRPAVQVQTQAQPAQPVTAPAKPAQPVQQPRQATPAQPEPKPAAPVQGGHWQTHRVDPWAMPAPEQPATETTAEGGDWRRNVPQPAKPATKPWATTAPADTNTKETTK